MPQRQIVDGGSRGLGEGRGVNRDKASVWEDEEVLEMHGGAGNGRTTLRMYLMLLSCALKNG